MQPCSSQSPKSLASAILVGSNFPLSSLGGNSGACFHRVLVGSFRVEHRLLTALRGCRRGRGFFGGLGSSCRFFGRSFRRSFFCSLFVGSIGGFGFRFGVGFGSLGGFLSVLLGVLRELYFLHMERVFLVQDLVQCHNGSTGNGHSSGRAKDTKQCFHAGTSLKDQIKRMLPHRSAAFRQAPPKWR